MLSSDETKAGGKSNSRKERRAQNRDKAGQQKRKAAAQVPEIDQPPNAPDQAEAETPLAPVEAAAPSPADTSPIVPAVAADSAPVSYRTLADAWGDYSRTSLEQTRSYFEKMAGVRSLGAALEIQAEFTKQACETFVAQSQRIGELQGELAKQRMKRLEGLWRK